MHDDPDVSEPDEPREVEVALIVSARDPDGVMRRIGQLRRLAGHPLEELATQELEDTYHDLPGGELGARRIALRVRRVDGAVLLTVKAERTRGGFPSDRTELEAPWSPEFLESARGLLERSGIDLPGVAFSDHPTETLTALGLVVVQRRSTRRERRAVHGHGGAALAELALDSVAYDGPGGAIRLFQVEVEARSPEADLPGLAGALVHEFPALRPWPYGKLPTGLAIVDAAGPLELGRDGALLPQALERLEAAVAAR